MNACHWLIMIRPLLVKWGMSYKVVSTRTTITFLTCSPKFYTGIPSLEPWHHWRCQHHHHHGCQNMITLREWPIWSDRNLAPIHWHAAHNEFHPDVAIDFRPKDMKLCMKPQFWKRSSISIRLLLRWWSPPMRTFAHRSPAHHLPALSTSHSYFTDTS
jgi:hypothetical protein